MKFMRSFDRFWEKTTRLSALLFLVFLPLNSKKLLWPFGRGLNDLQGFFIYASDIFLLIFVCILVFSLRSWREKIKWPRFAVVLLPAFLAVAALSLFQAGYFFPAFYHFLKLLLAAAAAAALAIGLKNNQFNLKEIAAVIAGGVIFQSWLGFYQFAVGKSLGLWWLGEPVVADKFTAGMARITADGQVFLRAFGTLPHANIFAAFLVFGLLALSYLWLIRQKGNLAISLLLGVGFLSVIAGLAVSFSRSGWLAAIVGLMIFIFWGLKNKESRQETFSLGVVLLAICSLLLFYWSWLILPRAGFSLTEVSVADRLTYNKIGWEILQNNPLGIGIGNQVFYAADQGSYQAAGLKRATLWQPIHNLYLLIGAEIGWFGLALFLVFLGWLIWRFFLQNKILAPPDIFVFSALTALLFFGLFDHFLWDLQSGVLMFWLAVGIMLAGVLETRS